MSVSVTITCAGLVFERDDCVVDVVANDAPISRVGDTLDVDQVAQADSVSTIPKAEILRNSDINAPPSGLSDFDEHRIRSIPYTVAGN